ncbi:hypothetical protein GBAR_LOCUS12586 [Geodia barretti]|uniref:Uncharacterized protein n=1 Tax=Geodia barretti TaxID=519541 RepID=A0AA35WP50_GEOBA|nr:hypothetical protein GBAR_LOCUS12586 [Geodia barretti]
MSMSVKFDLLSGMENGTTLCKTCGTLPLHMNSFSAPSQTSHTPCDVHIRVCMGLNITEFSMARSDTTEPQTGAGVAGRWRRFLVGSLS